MQHLDEGTIHAWLDGALDDAEAARVEAHVAECAECAAAVAEARGLIAGASRVLSALDHVPAHVVPPALKGGGSGRGGGGPNDAGAGVPGVVSLGARRSAWKRFHMTPARVAAAAVILVAAGTTLVAREGMYRRPSVAQAPVASKSGPGPRVQEQAATTLTTAPSADSVSTVQSQIAAGPANRTAEAVQKSRTTNVERRTASAEGGGARADQHDADLSKKVSEGYAAPRAASELAERPPAVAGGAAGAARPAPQPSRPTALMDSVGGVAGRVSATSTELKVREEQRPRREDSVGAAATRGAEARQLPAGSAAAPTVAFGPRRELADSGGAAAKRLNSTTRSRISALAAAEPPASPLGAAGCYETAGATSDSLVPRRFVLDTTAYVLRDGSASNARVVTIPDESATLPRGYWRLAGNAVQVVWNDNAWPRLSIIPSSGVASNAPTNAIVEKNGAIPVSIRRCNPAR